MITELREITDWGDNTPNHTYYIDEAGKCIAYKPAGSDTITRFTSGMMFSKRLRKFKSKKLEGLP